MGRKDATQAVEFIAAMPMNHYRHDAKLRFSVHSRCVSLSSPLVHQFLFSSSFFLQECQLWANQKRLQNFMENIFVKSDRSNNEQLVNKVLVYILSAIFCLIKG